MVMIFIVEANFKMSAAAFHHFTCASRGAIRCFSSSAAVRSITKLSVIGSGLMGTGIAQVRRCVLARYSSRVFLVFYVKILACALCH